MTDPVAASLTPERLLRRLEWRVLRRLDGRLQGDHRTAFRGTGPSSDQPPKFRSSAPLPFPARASASRSR